MAFEKKGLRPRENDHTYYYLYVSDKKTPIRTKLSRGSKYRVYGPGLLKQVAWELKLTLPELARFVDCPLEYSDYVRLMRDRGHLR